MVIRKMNNNLDLSFAVRSSILEKKKSILLENSGNLLDIFRLNFTVFEDLVYFYKKYPSYGSRHNENAYGEIRKILINNKLSSEDLTEGMVRSYMSRVRKEKEEV